MSGANQEQGQQQQGKRTEKQTGGQMIVYGHNFCGQALSLARALKKNQIEHEWRDVMNGDPIWKNELQSLANGNMSVPTVVFEDGTVMVEPWPAQVLDHIGISEPGFLDKLARLFGGGDED